MNPFAAAPPVAARVPRRLLVTLRLGEMPEHIPAWRAVTNYGVAPAERIDGGVIDRLLRHHGGTMRCARVHSARRPRSSEITGARRFDDVEQLSGVARVLRIEVQNDAALQELVAALQQVPQVDSALVEHLSFAPLDFESAASATAQALATPAYDAQEAWAARELIHLPQALGYTQGDAAVIIGIADTGVSTEHRGLPAAALRRGFDAVDLDAGAIGGLEIVGATRARDGDPVDDVGHGTGCAGILRAEGLDLPPGAAGVSSILPVRVLCAALAGSRRVGVGSIANIDAGMKRLIDLGVKVINMSFGTAEAQLAPGGALPHLEVVRYALARGVILVAASGNSGLEERYFPAAHPGVIAVGAVNSRAEPAPFSTRGPHVALCAPGAGIWTCGIGDDKGALQRASGTSFAAPFVTAACALLAARANARAWPLSGARARELLIQSCRPHARADTVGYGAGVLDIYAALKALENAMDADSDDNPTLESAAPAAA